MNLHLEAPSLARAESFRSLVEESIAAGEDSYPRLFSFLGLSLDDLAGLVAQLGRQAQGELLRPGQVTQTTSWLVDGDTVIGESRFRHWLTPSLEIEGGHIGYLIRPSRRRQGCGTRLLALTLSLARAHGLTRVLVTCNTANQGSARVIQKNGGRFAGEVSSPATGLPVSRYWIAL